MQSPRSRLPPTSSVPPSGTTAWRRYYATCFSISPAYLESLSEGKHTLNATFADGTGTADFTIAETASETVALTFYANGGVGTMAAMVVTKGANITLTKNAFTKDGYTFAGWNLKKDGTGQSYRDGQTLTASFTGTLYAQWTKTTAKTTTTTTAKTTTASTSSAKTYTLPATRRGHPNHGLIWERGIPERHTHPTHPQPDSVYTITMANHPRRLHVNLWQGIRQQVLIATKAGLTKGA